MTYKLQGTCLQVVFDGDVLSTNVARNRDEVTAMFSNREVEGPGWDTLILDLQRARMVDSAGLNLIVSLIKKVQPRKPAIEAHVSDRTLHRLLQFTRLDRYLKVVLHEGGK